MGDLFENNGAKFSDCKKYRYSLWRIWDISKPLVMFIGLNPSTAREHVNDNTIRKVISISKNLGYGGVYMMNCFPFVSTEPDEIDLDWDYISINDEHLERIGKKCKDVIFAWGKFDIVTNEGRDLKMQKMFPNAKALHINKNGSPKHPLYCKADIIPVDYCIIGTKK